MWSRETYLDVQMTRPPLIKSGHGRFERKAPVCCGDLFAGFSVVGLLQIDDGTSDRRTVAAQYRFCLSQRFAAWIVRSEICAGRSVTFEVRSFCL